ncbi:MAG: helix-turn-helix domain-containing protein, partial [Ktedonobacteraceae bacterium]
MKEQSSFGALLKRYRLAAGLSQEALAARASLSARTISDLERGIHGTPHTDT